eukprot:COSAG01_NODE_5276_length_4364_cov_3.892380_6_plen_111_part_00
MGSGSVARGEVLLAPEMRGQTFIESMGGTSPAAAARRSVGSILARWQNVAYLQPTHGAVAQHSMNVAALKPAVKEQILARNGCVTDQSAICTILLFAVPRTAGGKKPPDT